MDREQEDDAQQEGDAPTWPDGTPKSRNNAFTHNYRPGQPAQPSARGKSPVRAQRAFGTADGVMPHLQKSR